MDVVAEITKRCDRSMKQTVETELQRVLAAYREQESEIERHATAIAELRHQMTEMDTKIAAVKTALDTASNPPELDLAVIRAHAAERRQAENRLEQLGQERAKIAAQICGVERVRRALEQDLKDSQQRCWQALFDELKTSVDAGALESLLVAGLQAGHDERAVRAAILPIPADRNAVAARLRERFALPQ